MNIFFLDNKLFCLSLDLLDIQGDLRDLLRNKIVFFLKKNRHVTIRDFKKQKNLIF